MGIKEQLKWVCITVCMLNVIPTNAQDSYRSKWLPDHAKLQFAGGIGFLSIGAGYKTKKDKLHGDLYYGYTPKSVGGLHIHALTAKGTWFPFKNIELKTIQIRPFTAGLLVNYTFGKQYFGFTPENYPFDYYDFPTAFHVGGFIGGQVNKEIRNPWGIKRIGLYYELGTYDVEVLSYARNPNALSIADILNLGIGVIATF
jgi:hypothetical protein